MTLPALELGELNLKLKCLNQSNLNSSVDSALLTPSGFILLAATDTVYCLPLMEIGKQPRALIKRLKNCHSISILPLTSVVLICVDKSTRYYDLRQIEKSCLQLWDMSTNQLNVLPNLRTPAPPALEESDQITPPTPTTPPFTISPSMPNIVSPELPPLPFQIEEDSSLFSTATPLQANTPTIPIHQRRNARQPSRLNTPPAQAPSLQHTRSRSEDFTPLSSEVIRRELELAHPQLVKSRTITNKAQQPFKLSYKNLNDINEPSILRTAETSELSYLAILSLTPLDNETKQAADQTTVSLFAGTQHAPLSLVKAFILPDKPVDIQLSIKGDEMSEIMLVYDKSIFALNRKCSLSIIALLTRPVAFSINVREIKVGRNGRRRRNQPRPSGNDGILEHAYSAHNGMGAQGPGDNTCWSNEIRLSNELPAIQQRQQNGDLPSEASSNSLAASILANNAYTNFTPPLIDSNSSSSTAPTRRSSNRFGSGLSRWTSMLQRPFLQRSSSNSFFSNLSNNVMADAETPQEEAPSPQQETKKIIVNPHYTTLIQLQLPPPLPAAALEKMFTLPPRYDELEAQKSRSVFMNKNASQISAHISAVKEDELKKCWFYLDPRGIEHGKWGLNLSIELLKVIKRSVVHQNHAKLVYQ